LGAAGREAVAGLLLDAKDGRPVLLLPEEILTSAA